VAEPANLPTSPEGWGAFLAALVAIAAATRKGLQKAGLLSGTPEAYAKAFFAEKSAQDREHREALIAAIHHLTEVTREEHEQTREELRRVNDATRESLRGLLQQLGVDTALIKDRLRA
jgi:pyrroloquinoline quinone (PQQ) biosynthesis protein C